MSTFEQFQIIRSQWQTTKRAFVIQFGFFYILAGMIYCLALRIYEQKWVGRIHPYLVYGRGPTAWIAASVLESQGFDVTLMTPQKYQGLVFYAQDSLLEVTIPLAHSLYPPEYLHKPISDEDRFELMSLTGCSLEEVQRAIDQLGSITRPFEQFSVSPERILTDTLWQYSAGEERISLNQGQYQAQHLILCDEYPLQDIRPAVPSPRITLTGLMENIHNQAKLELAIRPYALWNGANEFSLLPDLNGEFYMPHYSWSLGPLWFRLSPLWVKPNVLVASCLSLVTSWDPLRDSFLLALLTPLLLRASHSPLSH